MPVRVVILILCSLLSVYGEQPAQDKIRAAMQASLDQQKASVRRQADNAQPVPPGTFFTIPWPGSPASASQAAASQAASPGDFACDPISEPELTPLIEAAAKREEIQPNLIRAVVQKESAARPCAVS